VHYCVSAGLYPHGKIHFGRFEKDYAHKGSLLVIVFSAPKAYALSGWSWLGSDK